jgi:heme/copper-type cytochrome/quinol oxidase subunit 3
MQTSQTFAQKASLERTPTNKNRLGMGLFLASETIFFLILILSFIYFRGSWISGTGPNPADNLDVPVTGLFSLALFSSSGTLWFAERSLKRGNQSRFRTGLLLTVLLGATFLIGQGLEYAHLFSKQVTISQNLFGTTFFTLTGLHGFHVFVGLVMLTILLGLSLTGGTKVPRAGAVETIALYWHFVDLVWVFIFSIVYLWTLAL